MLGVDLARLTGEMPVHPLVFCFHQRNATYANLELTSSDSTVQENGIEDGNHTHRSMLPTPMTPASDCPLLNCKESNAPSENPYSSLGELTPIHLISFAHQIARGMVS